VGWARGKHSGYLRRERRVGAGDHHPRIASRSLPPHRSPRRLLCPRELMHILNQLQRGRIRDLINRHKWASAIGFRLGVTDLRFVADSLDAGDRWRGWRGQRPMQNSPRRGRRRRGNWRGRRWLPNRVGLGWRNRRESDAYRGRARFPARSQRGARFLRKRNRGWVGWRWREVCLLQRLGRIGLRPLCILCFSPPAISLRVLGALFHRNFARELKAPNVLARI
jgi:hypothetical protein